MLFGFGSSRSRGGLKSQSTTGRRASDAPTTSTGASPSKPSWPTTQANGRRAQRALDRIDTLTLPTDSAVRGTRGNMRLARGATNDARTDAAAVIDYATQTSNDEILLGSLALNARCHAAEGHETQAIAECERFLELWHTAGGLPSRAVNLGEITPTLATTNRHAEIQTAAQLLPQACRWREPLLAIATEHYGGAATLYEQIGSQPLAADAHLLAAQQATDEGRTADAHQHAEVVLGFAKRTGASLYERRAGAFVKATA